jgi:predicted HTH transcriptional regulator
LLSNIVLDELDKELESRGLSYVRYAEDFQIYVKTKRSAERVKTSVTNFIEKKLRLKENEYLKRAALLLFHPDPEQFFTGAFVKIGYFRTPSDLRFQDVIHGYLFEQVEKTMDLLMSKYLEAQIRYEGVSRIEEYPYPEPALREALLNAIAHKDYGSGNPIQIKVYEDRINFWNAGQLPDSLTVDSLMTDHPSIPFNPDIATAFFRAGLIEAWGRGTLKIIEECRNAILLFNRLSSPLIRPSWISSPNDHPPLATSVEEVMFVFDSPRERFITTKPASSLQFH